MQQQPGLKVVGEALDAQDLLAQTEQTCRDLVALDWELPGLAVVDWSSALGKFAPIYS